MTMLYLRIRKVVSVTVLLMAFCGPAFSTGPIVFDDEPAVSIYRDFDDGLFGRSLYRGVVFSVKLGSFDRYRTLPVRDIDGLTAYLVSSRRGEDLAAGRGPGISMNSRAPREDLPQPKHDPETWLYIYDRDGITVAFSLEEAPKDLFDEIRRTYTGRESVIEEVSESYRNGYIIRIHNAENVYRPEFARIDYEDVLVSAALIGDTFQPLWGIHDGNDITARVE
ncbi:MAG: hypothetical protein KAJ98_05175 [Spirochaetaceae bacterium]|nr:hypothetical protein [Spirochaetaceae bacterium]